VRGKEYIKEKREAVCLRKSGFSIAFIEKQLGINRSTLSGWLKDIVLSDAQRKRLASQRKEAGDRGRLRAIKWHNNQKLKRLATADRQAHEALEMLDLKDESILNLALAMLYWGEGFKKIDETGLGNSDPQMLKIFLYCLRSIYKVPEDKIRCELYLRMDQNENKVKEFWSKELNLLPTAFRYTHFDARTKDTKTRPGYMGVCTIRCGNVAIKRKLINISRLFAEKLLRA